MKKVKKFVSILIALVMSICVSTSLVSAEKVSREMPILQNKIDGVPDDVIHIEFNPNTRMNSSGAFSFEFVDQVPSDYFLLNSTTMRIYLTPSSTINNDDFTITLHECKTTSDNMSDPYFREVKTYNAVANGQSQYAEFTGLSTNRYYYFVLKQTGWFWNNGTISGAGHVTNVRGVHDYYVGF